MFEQLKKERAFWKRLRSFPNEGWGCNAGLEPIKIRALSVFLDTEKKELVFSILEEETVDTIIRTLSFEQIQDVDYYVEKTTVTKNKKPIARAIVGGALAGGAGAVVGAVSGQGEKKETIYTAHLVFTYRASSGALKEIDLIKPRTFEPEESQFVKSVMEIFCPHKRTPPQSRTSKYEKL